MRILLVENEPDLGEAIKRILTQKAYIVDWVRDGIESWDYLENQWTQYTLVIFDWLLLKNAAKPHIMIYYFFSFIIS